LYHYFDTTGSDFDSGAAGDRAVVHTRLVRSARLFDRGGAAGRCVAPHFGHLMGTRCMS
jgi:hypothetical protein